MYEYMRGLQRQFFKEPDFPELRQELNELHQELAEDSPKDERRKLLKLVDLEAELRDEISLASFAAGFRLAWGIIGELNIRAGGGRTGAGVPGQQGRACRQAQASCQAAQTAGGRGFLRHCAACRSNGKGW